MKVISFGILLVINLFLRSVQCENLKLLILHNNDMHSRFEETSRTSGTCKDKSNCYGGFGRVLHVVREARKAAADGTGPPVLFLNAGDTYTGTSWFSVHKWRIAADFMNLLQPDVAAFGNHDFDYGVAGLVPFLNAVNFPIVAANLNFENEPQLLAINVTRSHVLLVSGVKIGVIGYLTPETADQSSPENVIFYNEIDSVREESERLSKEGVKIIMALGHSGYEVDQKVAREVPLVDVVVGGHTNTFLWNGPQPDLEEVGGPYPTIVEQDSGKQVPVVQAFAYTKYMGRLHLEFDPEGDLVAYGGEPQLMNRTVPQDPSALDLLERYRPAVDALRTEIVGRSVADLSGSVTQCRLHECNFANFVTDALIHNHVSSYQGEYWTDAPIALINAGTIRKGIRRKREGSVSKSDIYGAIPLEEPLYSMYLTGTELIDTLEIGVRGKGDASSGEIIHGSGLFYKYDLGKQVGSRVSDVKIRCGSCKVPTFGNISPNSTYRIVTTAFLTKGGDGHTVLRDKGRNKTLEAASNWEAIIRFFEKTSPIYPQEEGRVVLVVGSTSTASSLGSAICIFATLYLILV
ncbi:protein 5NUC-like isoform X3 [Photinus pyralis]|nr:protein 5NUC-like isoform X3 [Photinus pyralis]